ncbi:MAG: hypothetical protein VBE63_29570, partial [Lamprobacter sp.]|uniref:hypothetical protein n=1 Tax=Lamprobacter sp. TaxID=3100796 RepID=UPI002B259E81
GIDRSRLGCREEGDRLARVIENQVLEVVIVTLVTHGLGSQIKSLLVVVTVMQVVNIELDNRMIKDDEMKFEPGRMITQVSIPVDDAVKKDDAIARFAKLIKNSQLPAVIVTDFSADCVHGRHPANNPPVQNM